MWSDDRSLPTPMPCDEMNCGQVLRYVQVDRCGRTIEGVLSRSASTDDVIALWEIGSLVLTRLCVADLRVIHPSSSDPLLRVCEVIPLGEMHVPSFLYREVTTNTGAIGKHCRIQISIHSGKPTAVGYVCAVKMNEQQANELRQWVEETEGVGFADREEFQVHPKAGLYANLRLTHAKDMAKTMACLGFMFGIDSCAFRFKGSVEQQSSYKVVAYMCDKLSTARKSTCPKSQLWKFYMDHLPAHWNDGGPVFTPEDFTFRLACDLARMDSSELLSCVDDIPKCFRTATVNHLVSILDTSPPSESSSEEACVEQEEAACMEAEVVCVNHDAGCQGPEATEVSICSFAAADAPSSAPDESEVCAVAVADHSLMEELLLTGDRGHSFVEELSLVEDKHLLETLRSTIQEMTRAFEGVEHVRLLTETKILFREWGGDARRLELKDGINVPRDPPGLGGTRGCVKALRMRFDGTLDEPIRVVVPSLTKDQMMQLEFAAYCLDYAPISDETRRRLGHLMMVYNLHGHIGRVVNAYVQDGNHRGHGNTIRPMGEELITGTVMLPPVAMNRWNKKRALQGEQIQADSPQ